MTTVVATEPLSFNTPLTRDLMPNGTDSQKPSRQSTLKSSASVESRNGGPRLRLAIPEDRIGRPSMGSYSSGKMNLEKLRRLSRAYDLPSKLSFFLNCYQSQEIPRLTTKQ